MIIKTNDRVMIAGKTGSGKTWLARSLLAGVSRLIVIDSKVTLTDWGLKEPTAKDWRKFAKGSPGRYRIVPPIADDLTGWFDELFQRLYAMSDLTIYIDEAHAVCPGVYPQKWLTALYTRGREKRIGVWASTQRPAWIPLFLLSEADWLIAFRLNVESDRRRLASIAGSDLMEPITDEHGFWLYEVNQEAPIYYRTAVLEV